jgi:hypothetical protein
MPGGTVRVYQADSRGGVQFVGEDAFSHTPKDEALNLKIGHAFDVICERKPPARGGAVPLRVQWSLTLMLWVLCQSLVLFFTLVVHANLFGEYGVYHQPLADAVAALVFFRLRADSRHGDTPSPMACAPASAYRSTRWIPDLARPDSG